MNPQHPQGSPGFTSILAPVLAALVAFGAIVFILFVIMDAQARESESSRLVDQYYEKYYG